MKPLRLFSHLGTASATFCFVLTLKVSHITNVPQLRGG